MITNIQPVPQTAPAMKTDAAEFKPLTPAALSKLSAEPFVPQQVISAEKKVEPEGSKLSKLLETISDGENQITEVVKQIQGNRKVTETLLKKYLDLIQLPKDPSTIFCCNKSLLARELGQQKPIYELDSKFSKGGLNYKR